MKKKHSDVQFSPRLESYSIPKRKRSFTDSDKMPLKKVQTDIVDRTKKSDKKKKDDRPNQAKSAEKTDSRPSQAKIAKKTDSRPSQIKTAEKRDSRPSQAKTAEKTDSRPSQANTSEVREERIVTELNNSLTLAFAYFLSHIITIFEKKNISLQSQCPQIHVMKKELEDLLRSLYVQFVRPSVVVSATDLTHVDYRSVKNQKDDNELVTGMLAGEVVDILSKEEKRLFYSSVRKYFEESCNYIVSKFPLRSEVLIYAEVADVNVRQSAKFSSIKYFTDRFPSMILRKDGEDKNEAMDALQVQFVTYQVSQLSREVLESAADKQWTMLASYKNAANQLLYDRLARVMLGILTIPHSNAECERLFSQVRKNRTDFRGSMSDNLRFTACHQI